MWKEDGEKGREYGPFDRRSRSERNRTHQRLRSDREALAMVGKARVEEGKRVEALGWELRIICQRWHHSGRKQLAREPKRQFRGALLFCRGNYTDQKKSNLVD